MIIVAYYTDKYKEEFERFKASCENYDFNFYIEKAIDRGSWEANTHYKAEFVKKVRDIFKLPVVYVDIDAIIKKEPVLFDELDCDISAHILKHRLEQKEFLGGTIYINYTDKATEVVNKWVEKCSRVSELYEQVKLRQSIDETEGVKFEELPIEYCAIFDHQKVQGIEPVILHMQASRKYRR